MLRPYRRGDAQAMYRLDRVCFEEAFRFSLASMQRFAEAPGAVCVVAKAADGELAGFAIAERDGEVVYLVTLDVAPAFRRCGLSRSMLAWFVERAAGAAWIELHVFAGNAGALAFYEREGFSFAGREPDFYGRGMDALVYRRAIRSGG